MFLMNVVKSACNSSGVSSKPTNHPPLKPLILVCPILHNKDLIRHVTFSLGGCGVVG